MSTYQEMRTQALADLAHHRAKKAAANKKLMELQLTHGDRTAAEFEYAYHAGAASALEGLLELPWAEIEKPENPEGLKS